MTNEPSAELVLKALYAAVRMESNGPAVAAAIGMSYDAFRRNMVGQTQIKMQTVYAILNVLGLTWADLMKRASALMKESDEDAP